VNSIRREHGSRKAARTPRNQLTLRLSVLARDQSSISDGHPTRRALHYRDPRVPTARHTANRSCARDYAFSSAQRGTGAVLRWIVYRLRDDNTELIPCNGKKTLTSGPQARQCAIRKPANCGLVRVDAVPSSCPTRVATTTQITGQIEFSPKSTTKSTTKNPPQRVGELMREAIPDGTLRDLIRALI
jgi:hypothetical protein